MTDSRELAAWNDAKRAIAAITTIHEAIELGDKAEAMQVYARRSKDVELIKKATEVRERAQRKLGELMASMPKAPPGGDRGADGQFNHRVSEKPEGPPALAELGIDKNLANRARKNAKMDEAAFEVHVEKVKSAAAGEKKPKRKTTSPEELRARAIIEEQRAAGKEPIYEDVEKLAGTSSTPVRRAFSYVEAKEEVRAEVEAENESIEHFVRIYLEKLEEVLQIMKWPQFNVMKRTEFNKLRVALHPDTFHTRTLEQVTEAFNIIQKYEIKMVSDEPERKLSSALPRTREELLARKRST